MPNSSSMLSASSFSDRPLARQASHVRSTTPIPDNSAVSQPHPTVRGPAAGESCSVEDVTQLLSSDSRRDNAAYDHTVPVDSFTNHHDKTGAATLGCGLRYKPGASLGLPMVESSTAVYDRHTHAYFKIQLIDTVSPEYSCIEGFISISYIGRIIALVLTPVILFVALAFYASHLFSVFIAHYECRKFCF